MAETVEKPADPAIPAAKEPTLTEEQVAGLTEEQLNAFARTGAVHPADKIPEGTGEPLAGGIKLSVTPDPVVVEPEPAAQPEPVVVPPPAPSPSSAGEEDTPVVQPEGVVVPLEPEAVTPELVIKLREDLEKANRAAANLRRDYRDQRRINETLAAQYQAQQAPAPAPEPGAQPQIGLVQDEAGNFVLNQEQLDSVIDQRMAQVIAPQQEAARVEQVRQAQVGQLQQGYKPETSARLVAAYRGLETRLSQYVQDSGANLATTNDVMAAAYQPDIQQAFAQEHPGIEAADVIDLTIAVRDPGNHGHTIQRILGKYDGEPGEPAAADPAAPAGTPVAAVPSPINPARGPSPADVGEAAGGTGGSKPIDQLLAMDYDSLMKRTPEEVAAITSGVLAQLRAEG